MDDSYNKSDSLNKGDLPDELTPPDNTKSEASKYSLIDKVKKHGKIAVSVLGVLTLLAAVGVGVVLVQRDQDIREKAATSCTWSTRDQCGAPACPENQRCQCNGITNECLCASEYQSNCPKPRPETCDETHHGKCVKENYICSNSTSYGEGGCGSGYKCVPKITTCNPPGEPPPDQPPPSGAKCCTKFGACEANAGCGTGEACKLNKNNDGSLKNSACGTYVCWADSGCGNLPPPPPPPAEQRPSICGDISADKTTIAPGESVTLRSSTNGTHANSFWYIMYNRDNPYPPPPDNNPKPLCVPTGSNPGNATWADNCPSGTVILGYKASDTTGRSTGSITLPYEKIFINDANNGNQQAKRVSVSAYFSIGNGPFSHIAPACIQYIYAGETSSVIPGKCSELCTQDAGCETGLVCSSGSCRNPGCTAETDCICPLPPAACNGACTQDAGCETGLVCSSGSCRNAACTQETDCTCPAPVETADMTLKFRQQGVIIPVNDTVHVRLRKDGAIVYDFDWAPATSNDQGVWTISLNKDKDGKSVAPGTYTVLIKGRSHLQKKFTNVILAAGANTKDWSTNKKEELRSGDVNDDNKITVEDIARVLSFYIKGGFKIPVTQESKYSDINKDGFISIQDAALVAINWSDFTIEGDQ